MAWSIGLSLLNGTAWAQGNMVGWGTRTHATWTDLAQTSMLAAGYYHTLALKNDGTIAAWGSNENGQAVVPQPDAGFTAVAAGGYHSLGLKQDGSIVGWGNNEDDRCVPSLPNAGYIAISCGYHHSVALRSDGTVEAWGQNTYGQCSVAAPNSGFTAVSAGGAHSLALRANGSIAAWGLPDNGQCSVPAPNSDFIAVSAGLNHSLGLKSDGTVYAWGLNDFGQCSIPAPNSGFIAISAGYRHSVGLKADGTIVTWGDNEYGRLDVPLPNSSFVWVAAAPFHNIALREDGSFVHWGDCSSGQCLIPEPDAGYIAIATGNRHDLGLHSSGAITAWGSNAQGQCQVPPPNTGFSAVAAGLEFSIGLKGDGTIRAWGSNSHGQLGVPSPNSGFTAVAAGAAFGMALRSNGSVALWGDSRFGVLNIPAPNSGFTAIATGSSHCLGLRENGSITAWGYNTSGQCNVPAPNSGFVAVAAGSDYSLGLRGDGSIAAWGRNDFGQCNIPAPNSNFVAMAGGNFHGVGLKADGNLVAWGSNEFQQTVVPQPNEGFTAVSAFGNHSLALRGTVSGSASLTLTAPYYLPCTDGTWDVFEVQAHIRNGVAPLTGLVAELTSTDGLIAGPPVPLGLLLPDQTATVTFQVEVQPGGCFEPRGYEVSFSGDNLSEMVDGVIFVECCGPPASPLPVTDLQIQVVDSAHVELNWSPVVYDTDGQTLQAPLYRIHASPAPWFEPTLATRLITTTTNDLQLPIVDSLACFRVVVEDEPQDMVRIRAGQFMMGQTGVATPEHEVTLTHDFLLGRTEVTNAQFLEALNWANAQGLVSVVGDYVQQYGMNLLWIGSNYDYYEIRYHAGTQQFYLQAGTADLGEGGPGYAYPGGTYDPADHPVIWVSWFGAACYCDWRSRMEGLAPYYNGNWNQIPDPNNPYLATGYRLPTEAEWEFAAQFDDERTYPWGPASPTCTLANIFPCVGWTSPVGFHPSGVSGQGLQDMAGNAWEWCNDWFASYSTGAVSNPLGPNTGSNRVMRGGSGSSFTSFLRCASRSATSPGLMHSGTGVRLCRTAP